MRSDIFLFEIISDSAIDSLSPPLYSTNNNNNNNDNNNRTDNDRKRKGKVDLCFSHRKSSSCTTKFFEKFSPSKEEITIRTMVLFAMIQF